MEALKEKIIVGLTDFPPLSEWVDERARGLEAEIWERVAENLGITFEYRFYKFADMLEAVKTGEVRLGFGGVSVNEQRKQTYGFSEHTYSASPLILTRVNEWRDLRAVLLHHLHDIRRSLYYGVLGIAGIIFVFSQFLWLAERGRGYIDTDWMSGSLRAFWFGVMATFSITDAYFPKTVSGQFIEILFAALGWIILSLVVVEVLQVLKAYSVYESLRNIKDLSRKHVATKKGTTSSLILTRMGAYIHELPSIEKAFEMLAKRAVDALVFDAPVIRSVLFNNTHGTQYRVVGELHTDHQEYAFILRRDDDLIPRINTEIKKMKTSGELREIIGTWIQ